MIIANKSSRRTLLTVQKQYDFVVAGGGLSGVCTAIAAARKGIKVALIQDRPVLGGNASSEIRVWALGATSHMGNNNRWAREEGVIGEILVENLYRNKEGNPILFDALLLEKVLEESNITLYLNTTVIEVLKDNEQTLKEIIAFNSQNSTKYQLSATIFCDATGDGIIGYLAGASYRVGAEQKEEFQEGFSPSEEYGEVLGHTIFLYPKNTDKPVKFVPPSFALKDIYKIPKYNQISPLYKGCNYWWFEYGGLKDTIHESEEIKYELWKVVYGAWDHIKNSGLYPEAENMTLEWVGNIPGKRESRRFEGLYMLSQKDITDQTHFPDTIAYGGWAIDLHPAEGIYSPLPSCNQYHSKGVYEIPYRCYVSKDIDNLYMVGRLISASHVAFGSTRVMITCGLGGQAIGTAAAQCIREGYLPKDLYTSADRMARLQQTLNKDGQSIPHVPIHRENNLLNRSRVELSSSLCLTELPFDGEWESLEMSAAQMLPLQKDERYEIEVQLKATEKTSLKVQLMVSSKPFNYTPDIIVEEKEIALSPGEETVHIAFDKKIPHTGYGFFVFRVNPDVSIRMTQRRISGILSVYNKFNKAVNNWGKQMPPHDSGFESFEFFTPKRRPEGNNIAMKITPAISCFDEEALKNGYIRPYLAPNAWVSAVADEEPVLMAEWDEQIPLHEISLYFDTDLDHPMEPIQWGHPESQSPFCVKEYALYDDQNRCIYKEENNYRTINKITFNEEVRTRKLKIKFGKPETDMPVTLFGLYIE